MKHVPHHLVIDVEADGPTPVTHSLLQIGIADLNGHEFYHEFKPVKGQAVDMRAMNAIGLTPEQVALYPEAYVGFKALSQWVMENYGGEHVTTWSDNPAFDWQFVNGLFWAHGDHNPFGFSMRRIGDFYAGIQHNVAAASKWKKMRTGKHTHNALDDARGNAGALKKILEWSN